MRFFAAAALVASCATAAAIAPIWTYAISLALFGLPHVLVELRYVDQRFAGRLPRRIVAGLVLGLAAIFATRSLGVAGIGSGHARITTELALGVLLVACAWPMLRHARSSALAMATCTALLLGILYAPITTLVTMALLHNLTPVGFLAERLEGSARRRAMTWCALVFVGVPALLLALPPSHAWLEGPLTVGHLDDHLGSFVPPPLLGTAFADRLFAAAAFLQCMHYAVVLHVLPALSGGSETAAARVPWPRHRWLFAAVATVSLLMTAAFVADFRGARHVYSMFAAVHAWIEIPILLVACSVLPARAPAIAA